MAAPPRNDPYKNYKFRVEIEGLTSAGFAEVSGLSAEATVIEYREGHDLWSTRKLPGLVKYPNVTLRRGLSTSRELYDWWTTVVNGTVERRNVAIVLLDDSRRELVRWLLRNAWVAKIEFGTLEAEANEVLIETIELAHEGFELE